jgi:undecaprenyl-diphosphatase
MPTIVLEAIVLGIVQGATEFIPVSSSAHLIVVPWLFRWTDPVLTSLSFDVALHVGTLVAVVSYFASDWARLVKAWFLSVKELKINGDPDRLIAWFVLMGTIPGGLVGALAEKKIERLFHTPGVPIRPSAIVVMAAIIAAFGGVLLLADRLASHRHGLNELGLKKALTIGIAQALAVFPGVSRSGSTMTAGLALGLKREEAAKFSFLLSAPIIAGAGLKGFIELFDTYKTGALVHVDLIAFPIGVAAAAISGFLCIRFLLQFLKRHPVNLFAYYRWALALLLVVLAGVR